MDIGKKLRHLRKTRDLTLDEISHKCGVGKATLSRIENNITAGTLKTHLKICEALNINLRDLYEGIENPKEEIAALNEKEIREADFFSYDTKTRSVILTKNAHKKNMLPQLLILEPQGKTHVEENSLLTEKFVFCAEGQIQIHIKDQIYDLKKGTSLYFNSSSPHFFTNTGKNTAKCVTITSPVAL